MRRGGRPVLDARCRGGQPSGMDSESPSAEVLRKRERGRMRMRPGRT